MKITDLDREEYKEIVVYTRQGNHNDNLPVYLRRVLPGQLSPLHRHEMIQINYVFRGALIHQINDSQYELVKGDIFIIPPYIPHRLVSAPNTDFEIMELEVAPEFILGSSWNPGLDIGANASFFDFSYIEPFFVSECNVKPRLNLTGAKQNIVESMLNEIYQEYSEKEDSYILAVKADILKLLVILGRFFSQDICKTSEDSQLYCHHRDAMMRSVQYIDDHFTDPITIEDVSKVAMLSQSYFSYLFKIVTSQTFVEYLNLRRIQYAMELLSNTDRLVLDICYDAGFRSVNHYNRLFKKTVGLSPTQYRRANRRE